MPAKSEEKGREPAPAEWSPLATMRRDFDRMLDEFPWGWRRPLARGLFDVEPFFRGFAGVGAIPVVDIAEKDKEYEITAELPGMDESNIDVKFADGLLTQRRKERGERGEEKGLLSLRAPLWLFPAQLPGAGKRRYRQDRSEVRQRRAHGKIAQSAEAQKNEKKIAIKKG